MRPFKNIAILGCGWLGLPLAEKLVQTGYRVKGSTTRKEKIPVFESAGVEAWVIEVNPEGIRGDLEAFLEEVEILVVDIPPGLRKDPEKRFSDGIDKLGRAVANAGVKNVLFVSSTSVYADTESFKIYTEDTAPNADSSAGKELAKAERILQENSFFQTTVLRFGGLIGRDRQPVKFLAGRKDLPNPLGPVNLIHREDCIRIIECLLNKDILGATYNAVFPEHPTREGYYQKMAKMIGLETPAFDHSKPSEGKIISSSKLMRELQFEFLNPIDQL